MLNLITNTKLNKKKLPSTNEKNHLIYFVVLLNALRKLS